MIKAEKISQLLAILHKQMPVPVNASEAQFGCTTSGCENRSHVPDSPCEDCLTAEIVDLVGSDYEIERYKSLLNIQRELIAKMLRKSIA